ncbi:hypothetical protein [Polaribacter sp. Hel_I_88]|uniref:hypothetical protein n=1 Tax=Polaribacter sp. Hel_I_88 TaxID=1250006 RepID=UPI00047CC325|nr:hypothetical protein [Polaribacter sp. Hel_I_88]
MKQIVNKMIDLDLRGFKGTTTTLLGLFKHIAKRESWSDDEIQYVITEAKKHNDQDHLVETIREYCKY